MSEMTDVNEKENEMNEFPEDSHDLPFDLGFDDSKSEAETSSEESSKSNDSKDEETRNFEPPQKTVPERDRRENPTSGSNSSNNSKYNVRNNTNSVNRNTKDDQYRTNVYNYAVSMYEYAASIKGKGHASIADLMFKDLMRVIIATNTASSAIGRDKFLALLEEGYYASTRIIEYMRFLDALEVRGNMYEPLMENIERIQRTFASSIKTTRSKKQVANAGM